MNRTMWRSLVLLLLLTGCKELPDQTLLTEAADGPTEVAITPIPLAAPLDSRSAEISGLDWFGDWLILLPQYPENVADSLGTPRWFALHRDSLLRFIDAPPDTVLHAHPIPMEAPGLLDVVPGYEGFEALAIRDDSVFVALEGQDAEGMASFVLKGHLSEQQVTLDTSRVVRLAAQTTLTNFSNEALLLADSVLLAFYELNGTALNPTPRGQALRFDLTRHPDFGFPNLEYRVTDATRLDTTGHFWVVNYYYPGDEEVIVDDDALADQYGVGPTHEENDAVERLVEMRLLSNEVILAGTPPIQLELATGQDSRNWEGVARLGDRGLLLITDQYPTTTLAFVPFPEEADE